MNFKDYLEKQQQPIQQEKEAILLTWKKSVQQQTSQLNELVTLLLLSNSGGKNIRGTLVCLGYELFKKKRSAEIYKIAAAYEILHTSLLIHDDVMDKSSLRRGKQTIHQALGGDHYGVSQAISLGDVGFFLATKMISETSFLANIKSTIISLFSQIILDTITGQMLDVKNSSTASKLTEKEIIKIAELKTAQYTIAGPLLVGAMLADVDKKYNKNIVAFGKQLGIAYQMKDDILGIIGDEKKVGKSVTSDIEEGKNTLLVLFAYVNGTMKQKEILKSYYGKGKISLKNQEKVKKIFQETGAIAYTETMIQQYSSGAISFIPKLTKEKDMQRLLSEFVQYLVQRKK